MMCARILPGRRVRIGRHSRGVPVAIKRCYVGRFDRQPPKYAQQTRTFRWENHGARNAEWCACGYCRPVLCEGCGQRVCFTCGGMAESVHQVTSLPCPRFK